MADSVRGVIDYWTILDTGSADGTQDLIKKSFQGIPGQLFEEPFIDFATSRNRAMELAGENTLFLLSMDGDMILEGGDRLRDFCENHRNNVSAQSYMISIYDESNGLKWYNSWLIGAETGAKWVGRVHEYLQTRLGADKVEGAQIIYCKDRSFAKSNARYERDLSLLLKDHEENPENCRTVFYLAQTYDCLGKMDEAFQWYTKRSKMGGYAEEVYEALYRRARIAKAQEKPTDYVINLYLEAFEARPHRVEPLYAIGKIYKNLDRFDLAYLYMLRASKLPFPVQDNLFVHREEYRFHRWDLLAIISWYIKEYEVGEDAARRAWACDSDDKRLQRNLKFFADLKPA